jgi:hypothetical protein
MVMKARTGCLISASTELGAGRGQRIANRREERLIILAKTD